MRALVKGLTLMMCGAAMLAFGVAQARDRASPEERLAGYHVVEEDARIPGLAIIQNYDVVDQSHLVIHAGNGDLYMAELRGRCGRATLYDWSVTLIPATPRGFDRFGRVEVDGRLCAIRSFNKVERAEAAEAAS